MHTITLDVPTPTGVIELESSPGKPLFIVGRNGTGKSALVGHFVTELKGQAIYLPGSRPSQFGQESLSLTPQGRKSLTWNLHSWDTSPDGRWTSHSGTSRNEKAIHDLTIAETQFKVHAADEIVRLIE